MIACLYCCKLGGYDGFRYVYVEKVGKFMSKRSCFVHDDVDACVQFVECGKFNKFKKGKITVGI